MDLRRSQVRSISAGVVTITPDGIVRINQLEAAKVGIKFCNMPRHSPFRYLKTNLEIIRFAVMLNIRFPLSLRNVEDLLHAGGIEICHDTVRS